MFKLLLKSRKIWCAVVIPTLYAFVPEPFNDLWLPVWVVSALLVIFAAIEAFCDWVDEKERNVLSNNLADVQPKIEERTKTPAEIAAEGKIMDAIIEYVKVLNEQLALGSKARWTMEDIAAIKAGKVIEEIQHLASGMKTTP